MAKGDHVFVWRRYRGVPFQHHAIDVGDGSAIHFSSSDSDHLSSSDSGIAGPEGDPQRFLILQTEMSVVTRSGRDRLHRVRHAEMFGPDEIVNRAEQQLGLRGYDLIWNNCEHFATWCCAGSEESRQVVVAWERMTSAGLKTAAGVLARLALRSGARSLARGVSPSLLLADVAHWATEAGGQHVGLADPRHRRQAGRIVGGVTAIGVGSLAGPVGLGLAGGVWAASELASHAGRRAYNRLRKSRPGSTPRLALEPADQVVTGTVELDHS